MVIAKSQMTPREATNFLKTAREFTTAQVNAHADKIGSAIQVQMSHTRSFLPALGQYLHFHGSPFPNGMAKMMQPAFKMDLTPLSV